MVKILWSDEERRKLLKEVQRQHVMHPTMRTLDLLRMAQNVVLPADRKRDIKGNDQVAWVQKERDKWVNECSVDNYVPVPEAPELPNVLEIPKPDWKASLVELLSDAIIKIVADAIVRAREKLDLQLSQEPVQRTMEPVRSPTAPPKPLKKIAVYGLFSSQEQVVRNAVKGCFEFRFLKDVHHNKLVAGAQWADIMFIMTKFVSHDYEVIKKYGNIQYINGASSALIAELENMYLEDQK